MHGIEINDRALSVASDGKRRSVQVSAISTDAPGDGPAQTGAALWKLLRRSPRALSLRHFHDIAQHRLTAQGAQHAQRELAMLAAGITGPIWLAVGARFDVAALGELLAVAGAARLQVAGFVDTAAISAARLTGARSALVLDLGLFDCAITLVGRVSGSGGDSVDDGMQVRRVAVVQRGYLDLLETWLALVAEAMIRRTRFDPLHDGRHEQQLFDALPELVREAQASGSATATVAAQGESFSVELARDQFAAAAQPFIAELLRPLHELKPLGASPDLLAPQALIRVPGFLDALQAFSGSELLVVPEGFGAVAASQLPAAAVRTSGGVSYLRRVRSAQPPPGEGIERHVLGAQAARDAAPTHLLLGGAAHPITVGGIVIGRAPAAGALGGCQTPLPLPEGMAGVSRRHATVLLQADGVVLVDHSTHGSFVNDERVVGRRLLAAGDRIRVGTPGVELAAIRVAVTAAAGAAR